MNILRNKIRLLNLRNAKLREIIVETKQKYKPAPFIYQGVELSNKYLTKAVGVYRKLGSKRCYGCLRDDAEKSARVREVEDELDKEEEAHENTRKSMKMRSK